MSITKSGLPNISGNLTNFSSQCIFGIEVTSGVLTSDYEGGTFNICGISSTNIYMVDTNHNEIVTADEPWIPFTLHDDDQAVHPFNPDLSLLQQSDSTNDNIFAAAYVRVAHLDGSATIAPFNLNVETNQFAAQVDAGRDGSYSILRYWTAYIQGGFQAEHMKDSDPDTEGQIAGRTFPSSRGGMVYLETLRDYETKRGLPTGSFSRLATAHEVGHQFGLADETDGIMNRSPQPWFTPEHLGIIRSRLTP